MKSAGSLGAGCQHSPVERASLGLSRGVVWFLVLALLLVGALAQGNTASADAGDSVISNIGKAVEHKVGELRAANEASGDGEQLPSVDYTAHVGELMQNDVDLLSGCEITSLEIAM